MKNLEIKKSLLIDEINSLTSHINEEKQLELIGNLKDLLFMNRLLKENVRNESVDFINSEKFFSQKFTINDLKLRLIKVITEI